MSLRLKRLTPKAMETYKEQVEKSYKKLHLLWNTLTELSNQNIDGYAEVAPKLDPTQECWYLPVFGVYHPHKPGQIRCVFDSSATVNNISLNRTLLPGPDLTNGLLGILLRFRREAVAIVADIKQMFYSFRIHKEHRDYLRFFWHAENNQKNPLIEYRMAVHVFGNSPSPAIATYALRKSVEHASQDVRKLVVNDFYVDDALTSLPDAQQAVDLVKRTQKELGENNIVLHKVASNKEDVLSAFSPDQLANGLKDFDFKRSSLPTQRSLGLLWNMSEDTFLFEVSSEFKPFTRRGVLSVVNSLFDPIGFLAPITIQGKLILRNLMSETSDWDAPLPQSKLSVWVEWRDSLAQLKQIRIPRCYSPISLSQAVRLELHVFCDASELAIAAAAYLAIYCSDQILHTSFVIGKAKVAPPSGHTIPLELCAAVLAVQTSELALGNLEIQMHRVCYYSDSKVVLGYIHNSTRRFARYVSSRVEKVRANSSPEQWKYIPTRSNPADIGTRGISVDKVQESMWVTGPLKSVLMAHFDEEESERFPLVNPEEDAEIKNEVNTLHTSVVSNAGHLGSDRFVRFSSWELLVRALCLLMCRASNVKQNRIAHNEMTEKREQAEKLILRETQLDSYAEEYKSLTDRRPLSRNSKIIRLNPFIDECGLIRVGGRLNKNTNLTCNERNPIVVPGKHHIAILLVRDYHEKVCHQGRHFTEGAVRAGGFWITGSKRIVSSIIHACVICRKSRGNFGHQKMADLPADRIEQAPSFTFVGVDTFGPWHVISRKTRGGQANSKRWAILFTCLCVRAIHIEVVEDMTASAFLNALRRFVSVRGKVKQFRSDRGTNFVGATEDARIDAINIEDKDVKKFLFQSGTTWIFNTPHSSHMGGAWERLIGITRRILENMMLKVDNLTHEVLVTLMAEVSAIVNSQPLVPVSFDSDVPEVLTPATLLTQKTVFDTQPIVQLDSKDLYKSQWRRVQHLANTFWTRWRRDYLFTLQGRRKWVEEKRNLRLGDVILLRDYETNRIDWPMGRVTEVFPDKDGLVRRVKVRVSKEGRFVEYMRPVIETVLLISAPLKDIN